MQLTLPAIPGSDYQEAAARWLKRSFVVGRKSAPQPGTLLSLACWHRAYQVVKLDEASSGGCPAGLRFTHWCCLVIAEDKIIARLSIAPGQGNDNPRVVSQSHGVEVERWVGALSSAQAASAPDAATVFEPGLLLAPEAMATGLLLQPMSGASPVLVWSVVRRACACNRGLHSLDQFLHSCADLPVEKLAQELERMV